MDLLLEFLLEIVGECLIELMQNKNIPFIIRLIIFAFISIVYLSIVGLLIYFIIKNDNSLLINSILIILALFLLGIYIYYIYKLIKGKKNKDA